VNTTIWISTGLSTVIFFGIGLLGALAFNFPNGDSSILTVLNDCSFKFPIWIRIITQIGVYLFPIVTLLSGIPVFSIIIRYNLLENKICNKFWANFWAVIFPWLISVVFYTGNGLLNVVNWTSLVVNGIINFVIPMVLYLVAMRWAEKAQTAYDSPVMDIQQNNIPKSELGENFSALPTYSFVKYFPITLFLIISISILTLAAIILNIIVDIPDSPIHYHGRNATCLVNQTVVNTTLYYYY